jgi:hypothetical protein
MIIGDDELDAIERQQMVDPIREAGAGSSPRRAARDRRASG